MDIKTKFNINDKAWFMRNNIVETGRIKQLFVTIGGVGSKLDITYVVDDYHNMGECQLFLSKEELLKSL